MQIENSIAYLNNVFGRPLHIPDAPATQVHRIGLEHEPRYVESYKQARTLRDVKRNKDGLTEAQETVLKSFRSKGSKHTARQLSTRVGYTKAYTTILLCDLFKRGYLKRHKERVALTKQYVYSLKD